MPFYKSFFRRLLGFAFCAATLTATTPPPNGTYVATAYAQKGITASGQYVHAHVVAADPTILPIGSRIKIQHAGPYSGEYVVADTGGYIHGRRLDIFMPSVAECRKFGRRHVTVQVLSLGDGTQASAKQADKAVKQDVSADMAKQVVGNSATEEDWAANVKTTRTPSSPDTRAANQPTSSSSTSDAAAHAPRPAKGQQ